MNTELFGFLQAFDDDDLPDGAWQAKIEDGVVAWNEDKGTNLSPFDTWVEYVEVAETREANSKP